MHSRFGTSTKSIRTHNGGSCAGGCSLGATLVEKLSSPLVTRSITEAAGGNGRRRLDAVRQQRGLETRPSAKSERRGAFGSDWPSAVQFPRSTAERTRT